MATGADPKILDIVQRYLQALRDHNYSFESAWLFGSCARQANGPDSDIDVALVMKEIDVKFFTELELTKFRRSIDTRIEPHVLSPDDLHNPFGKNIKNIGIQVA